MDLIDEDQLRRYKEHLTNLMGVDWCIFWKKLVSKLSITEIITAFASRSFSLSSHFWLVIFSGRCSNGWLWWFNFRHVLGKKIIPLVTKHVSVFCLITSIGFWYALIGVIFFTIYLAGFLLHFPFDTLNLLLIVSSHLGIHFLSLHITFLFLFLKISHFLD